MALIAYAIVYETGVISWWVRIRHIGNRDWCFKLRVWRGLHGEMAGTSIARIFTGGFWRIIFFVAVARDVVWRKMARLGTKTNSYYANWKKSGEAAVRASSQWKIGQ